jgi:hypothetical protein
MLVVPALFLLAQGDEVAQIAAQALAKAKSHFEASRWFDCIEEAERARGSYQTLVEVYHARSATAEMLAAEEQVKVCNQLIKLAADKRKAEMPKAPEPEPPPPPPPEEKKVEPETKVEEPKPDPALPPPAAVEFGRILAGARSIEDSGAVFQGCRALAGRWRSFGRAAALALVQWQDATWKIDEEDRPLLKEYSEKFLAAGVPCDDRAAALFLAKAAETVEPLPRWRTIRLLALAHASESLQIPDSDLRPLLAKALELVPDRGITREGESILAFQEDRSAGFLAAWKKPAKVRDPVRDVYRALSTVETLSSCEPRTALTIVTETKPWFASSDPAAAGVLGAVKAALERAKPCRSCEGRHEVRCGGGCDERGRKRVACAKCGGNAFIQHPTKNKKKEICREPPPPGKKWEKDGHFCHIDCAACKGKGEVACNDCKAPWSADAILKALKPESCTLCQDGWILPQVKLPCARCFGTGRRYLNK